SQHAGHRYRAVPGFWASASIDDVPTPEPIPRGYGSGTAVLSEPGCAGEHLCSRREWNPGAAFGIHALRVIEYGAGGKPPGAVSVGYDLVQSCTGHLTGTGYPRHREYPAANRVSGHHSCQLSGNCGCLSRVALE